MKHVGCFLTAVVVVMIVVIWTSAMRTLWAQIKELCRDMGRDKDTIVVAGDTVLSVITNRMDGITVITYTLNGEGKEAHDE